MHTSPNRNTHTVSLAAAVATGVQKDMFALKASTNSRVSVHEVTIGQSTGAWAASTEIEMLPVSIHRGATVAAAGGSTGTVVRMDGRAATALAVCDVGASSVASGAAEELLYQGMMASGTPFIWRPSEAARPRVGLGERLSVRLGAGQKAITLNGTLTFEEEGKVPGE